MTDTNYNEIVPPDAPGCLAPYPQVDKAWADVAFPGLCNPDNAAFGIPSVCPVVCFPPRMGPGYAPLFMGNLGGTYQTTLPGVLSTFTYSLPTTYVLGAISPVPPIYDNQDFGATFTYGTIRILFNKLLDPQTVQPDPLVCQPPTTASSPQGLPRHGGRHGDPRGLLQPELRHRVLGRQHHRHPAPGRACSTRTRTYRVVGTVEDQQGNSAERRRHRHHRRRHRRGFRRPAAAK